MYHVTMQTITNCWKLCSTMSISKQCLRGHFCKPAFLVKGTKFYCCLCSLCSSLSSSHTTINISVCQWAGNRLWWPLHTKYVMHIYTSWQSRVQSILLHQLSITINASTCPRPHQATDCEPSNMKNLSSFTIPSFSATFQNLPQQSAYYVGSYIYCLKPCLQGYNKLSSAENICVHIFKLSEEQSPKIATMLRNIFPNLEHL